MAAPPEPSPTVPPPPPAHVDAVVDELHGVEVPDPYRWLEAADAPEVRSWIDSQNARTRLVLDELPSREPLRHRLTGLLHAGSSVGCQVAGDRVFTLERWGHHDQAVLVVRSASKPGLARTLVDPVLRTDDPTAALDWFAPSLDGRLVAYGLSTGGDERSTLHVLDVASGRALRDRIPNTRACSLAWLPDDSGFIYTRYPEPATLPEEEHGYWRKVYRHELGEDWHRDELVWGELPDKAAWPNVVLSPDGRWLLVHLSLGWSRVDVHLIDRTTGARTAVVEGIEGVSSFDVVGDELVGITNIDAPRGRVVSAPLVAAWRDNWVTLVPESEHRVLEVLAPTSSSLLVLGSETGSARVDRYGRDGAHLGELDLPGLGSLAGFDASRDREEAFLSYTSFAHPPTTYRWTPERLVDWSRLRAYEGPGIGPEGAYEVDQVWVPSTDGTEIPVFLVRAAGTTPSPATPCILTGYGGFAVTLSPSYSSAVVAACDDGFIYAIAGLRGGAEQGEAWHRAGMREHKQQVFDDFLAVADWLVATNRIAADRLAIRGGSNGGLLMGAAITQRPDVCAAAQIAVPLLDMVRYHRFLIARLWVPEYGDPEVAEEFAWLWEYSPYHRVVDGTCYPAVLLTTAQGDSRVDPSHARKMAARLQAATTCGDARPIFLRDEARAGHGQGKPASAQADELADVLAFLYWQLGVSAMPWDDEA